MVIKMDTQSNTLEDAALKRKEKLKALKRKRVNVNETNEEESNKPSLPKPIFRSYKPSDDKLKESIVPEAQPVQVEEFVEEQLKASTVKEVIDELDITNLAPRKPDWDLKRDVAKKLEKLERRTQKAIAELIRDRLKQRQEDLATVVTVGPLPENYNKANDS